ncbi:DUF6518 family protein [Streptomyces sp. NPDC087859]|uniref:DUF6518 family protein n=1 Tax=Streptomyces sp. NPDC087859 TaxID=3365812 RepID=UPI00381FB658
MLSSRPSIFAVVIAITSGVTLGALAPLLGTVETSTGHAAHLVLAAGWSWAALAFCVGLARKSRVESAIFSASSLVSAIIAYYITKLGQGEFLTAVPPYEGTQIHWYGFLSKTIFWCLVAAILGPLLGLAGNLARNPGIRTLPCRALIPFIAIVETTERLHVEASLQGEVASTTWAIVRLIAVAAFITIVVQVAIDRGPQPSVRRR